MRNRTKSLLAVGVLCAALCVGHTFAGCETDVPPSCPPKPQCPPICELSAPVTSVSPPVELSPPTTSPKREPSWKKALTSASERVLMDLLLRSSFLLHR